MAFTVEDKTVIKFLRQTKGHSAKQLLKMFPEKQWTLAGLNHLVRKIDKTGDVRRKSGIAVNRDAHALTLSLIKLVIWSYVKRSLTPHRGRSQGKLEYLSRLSTESLRMSYS